MTIGQSLLPEFDMEMAKTRSTLERVPRDKFGWKPHEKSFSFMELANHVARLPDWGSMTLTTDSMDLDPEKGEYSPPPPVETPQELLAVFDRSVSEMREALEAVSDGEILQPWRLLNADQELFSLPRIAVLRAFVLNHLIHHRGQLTMYLRLNDLPVPALYGPSADEEMM